MLPDSMFENAPEVDLFSDLTEEEKEQAKVLALLEIIKHRKEMEKK